MKIQLLNEITSVVFSHEIKRLKASEENLVKQHKEAGGSSDGFRFNGVIFTTLPPSLISRARFGSPDISLHKAITTYVNDHSTVLFDRIRVRQALTLALSYTRTKQDIRDALPECLIDVLPVYKDCPRTRPEAYTIMNNPRSYKQYMDIREKIEFYLASKLLY